MPARPVKIAPGYAVGTGEPPIFFAGPCVIESRKHSLAMAKKISAIAKQTGARIVFKSSFDKANRSSADSFRGPELFALPEPRLYRSREERSCSLIRGRPLAGPGP